MKQDALVLVSGGTGFLGTYVLRQLLRAGWRVRAMRRENSPMDLVTDIADQVEWVIADVTDIPALEQAFEGVTHVCHCAAKVSFHPRDVRRMRQVNIEGTANMVNLALDFGVKKFVHVSSIAALGRSKERLELHEKVKWVESPDTSQYALSKYQSELEVWRAHAEGLPVAIVNPAIILGSGFWNDGSAKFFQQINDGLKFSPTGRSGFVDVRDVARFMTLLLDSDINGERYVLCGDNVPYREFFKQIAANLGKKAPPITVTPLLAEVAWRVEWLKEKILGIDPIVTRESARASVSQYVYLNDKSRSVFNFEYLPFEQTIRETAAQFKACLESGKQSAVIS